MSGRLWSKVDFSACCWMWTASLNGDGYGKFWHNGRVQRAHRVVWEVLVGPIETGLTLDHLCKVHACVNPDHLEPVPMAVNARRGAAGAINRNRLTAITECPQGHVYDEANTYCDKRGKRNCRTCARIRATARRHAGREVTA